MMEKIDIPEDIRTAKGRLCVESYPRSGGSFHSHQMAVQQSMERQLEARGYTLLSEPDDSVPLLIIYQSQGRLGDELPVGLPRELYQGSRTIILAVIQDDEFNRADRSCLPPGFDPIHIMNIHVIPGQHQLHMRPNGRNDKEIQRLVELVPPRKQKSPSPCESTCISVVLEFISFCFTQCQKFWASQTSCLQALVPRGLLYDCLIWSLVFVLSCISLPFWLFFVACCAGIRRILR